MSGQRWTLSPYPGAGVAYVNGPSVTEVTQVVPVDRLVAILQRQARWAQEDAESHRVRGDYEAALVAQERERTYTHAANFVRDPDQPEPIRARLENQMEEDRG